MRKYAAIFAMLIFASPAASQKYKPMTQLTACEFHVWPTNSYHAYIGNWSDVLGGGLLAKVLDGDVREADPHDVKGFLIDTFSPEAQVSALKSIDLRSYLDASSISLTSEPVPNNSGALKSVKRRLTDSQAPCYIELIISDIMFQKDATIPKALRVHYTLRRFDPGHYEPLIIKGNMSQRLSKYPTSSRDDIEDVRNDLLDAYRRNFIEFMDEEVHGFASKD